MSSRFENWAENLYDRIVLRLKLANQKKYQLLQIAGALIIFIVCAASLQYIPFLARWFHINDQFFGKIIVYSLPVWVAFAFFLIWRS